MAEHEAASESEPEAPAVAPNDSGVAAAVALAFGKVRSGSQLPPDAAEFLKKQARMLDLQMEHLHEQRELHLSRQRLGRWKDRVSLALQLMTAVVGLAVAAVVAVMAWQAHQDRGLVIQAFSVPPDLAQRGLTGQVVASELLDQLAELQDTTVTARPASSYANDWGGDIKIEIPETGVSIGELNRLLREWLGSRTRISGEVVRTPDGLAVTARAGETGGQRFAGAEGDLDGLVNQAAKSVYARTQPYRYAVYLGSHGQQAEALAAFARLATSGPPEDRPWAYAGWASLAQDQRHPEEARRLAEAAIGLNPRLGPAYQVLTLSLIYLDRQEAQLAAARRSAALIESGKAVGLAPEASSASFLRGSEAALLGDYRKSIALLGGGRGEALRLGITVAEVNTEGRALGPPGLARQNYAGFLARAHDLSAARRAVAGGPSPMLQAVMLEDWGAIAALADAKRTDPAFPTSREYVTDLAAATEAYARLGRLADAEAAVAGLPTDCDGCLRARAEFAALKRDWPAANLWFDRWSRLSPSLPFPDTRWGEALLSKGDPDAAIAKLAAAHRRGPGFADPLELWGEALMRKGDFAGATAKFGEADADAPRWGRNHLRWGEALARLGKTAEAQAQWRAAAGMDLSAADRTTLQGLLKTGKA